MWALSRPQRLRYLARVTDDPNSSPTPSLPAPSPAAPDPLPSRSRGTRASAAAGRDARHGTVLRPWMRAYAEFVMLEATPETTQHTRIQRARQLSRLPLSRSALAALEAREDFQAYCDELRAGPVELARTRFASRFPEYVEAHFDALKAAQTADDYRAVAQITEPVLDRVYPKKGDSAAVAAQINVVLTSEQAAGFSETYEAPVVEVEAQALPPVVP